MYIATELTDYSLPQIAREFGKKDHTTVMYARDKVKQLDGGRRGLPQQGPRAAEPLPERLRTGSPEAPRRDVPSTPRLSFSPAPPPPAAAPGAIHAIPAQGAYSSVDNLPVGPDRGHVDSQPLSMHTLSAAQTGAVLAFAQLIRSFHGITTTTTIFY